MYKGMILFDLLTFTVLHHVADYLEPIVPADRLLLSRHLKYVMYDLVMYDAKSGKWSCPLYMVLVLYMYMYVYCLMW